MKTAKQKLVSVVQLWAAIGIIAVGYAGNEPWEAVAGSLVGLALLISREVFNE